MEKLVYRHNRITRATHWVNALALVILVMSGFQIFNAHPHLYWGSTSELTGRFSPLRQLMTTAKFAVSSGSTAGNSIRRVFSACKTLKMGPTPRAFQAGLHPGILLVGGW